MHGDGGGGGGGGGWFGGGGGGGSCHGMGGGGGSGHVSKDSSVVFGQTVSGRGVPESADGWVVCVPLHPFAIRLRETSALLTSLSRTRRITTEMPDCAGGGGR